MGSTFDVCSLWTRTKAKLNRMNQSGLGHFFYLFPCFYFCIFVLFENKTARRRLNHHLKNWIEEEKKYKFKKLIFLSDQVDSGNETDTRRRHFSLVLFSTRINSFSNFFFFLFFFFCCSSVSSKLPHILFDYRLAEWKVTLSKFLLSLTRLCSMLNVVVTQNSSSHIVQFNLVKIGHSASAVYFIAAGGRSMR